MEFLEISSLLEVFAESKKRRKSRLPAHILLIEDDDLTRRIVSHSFKQDYAMLTACNAKAGIADYIFYAPDVVFLDINLQNENGFDVLEQLLLVDPDAFIVMFSSNAYPENLEYARKLGAKGFIAKPFRKETLSSYISASAHHYQKSLQ